MKSARYYGPRDIRIDDIPDPPPPRGSEVTIDVVWGGICGTDLHEWLHGPWVIPEKDKPHIVTGENVPISFGHELTGRVSAMPESYTGAMKMGTPVIIDPRILCRESECPGCGNAGFDNMCRKWGYIGLSGGGGGGAGFSEKVNVETRMCHILPDDGSVDLNSVVLCQPLTVGRHAMNSSGIADYTGLNILVLGGGPVGIAILLNLRARGVGVGLSGRVFVSELSAKRCELIKSLDLSNDLLNPLNEDVAKECKERTNGKGVDVVFDAAGVEAAMLAGMESLKLRGTYVNVAGWTEPFQIPMKYAFFREYRITFSLGNNDQDYREVVEDFIAGRFKGAEKLITRRLPVEDLVDKGLEELVRNKDDHVKIVATWKKDLLS